MPFGSVSFMKFFYGAAEVRVFKNNQSLWKDQATKTKKDITWVSQDKKVVSIGHFHALLGSFLHTGVYFDYTSSVDI